MLVRNKKALSTGMVLFISFLLVLFTLFTPIFDGRNGMEFADDTFNKLAKGSAYYIPEVSESVKKHLGTPLEVTLNPDESKMAKLYASIFTKAGTAAEEDKGALKIRGDLGLLLQNIIRDADSMYHNNGGDVSSRYGHDGKEVMKVWWSSLSKIEKVLKKSKQIEAAKSIAHVKEKAVEPSYNFYGIETRSVADYAGMMSGILVFYVVYTMWWGYAIFHIFEGLGLSMKKAKVKKEV